MLKHGHLLVHLPDLILFSSKLLSGLLEHLLTDALELQGSLLLAECHVCSSLSNRTCWFSFLSWCINDLGKIFIHTGWLFHWSLEGTFISIGNFDDLGSTIDSL
jgi:hypothetical protein